MKHRNTSKWAKHALRRGAHLLDGGTKAAVNEQLRLGQELKQKVCTRPLPVSSRMEDGNTGKLIKHALGRVAHVPDGGIRPAVSNQLHLRQG